jgi:hypothetical protein
LARAIATALWGGAAIIALLWPGPLDGPLDGVPLDRPAEAILLGLTLPFLLWLQPNYLRSTVVRVLIAMLVIAKALSTPLARDGWCGQFDTPEPLVTGATGRIHTWDARADWRSTAPQCSAILTRPYREFKEFPVWFFNLPPADDNLPRPEDRPPYAALDMTVSGYLHADDPGELILETGETMDTQVIVDGRLVDATGRSRHQTTIDRGRHFIQIESHLTGNRWAFVPLWNGSPIGTSGFAAATTAVPSSMDGRVRGWWSWLIQIVAAAVVGGWIATFLWCWPDRAMLAFALIASLILGWLGAHPYQNFDMTPWARWSITALAAAMLLKVPPPQQTLKGAFVLIGIPWLVFVTVVHAPHIGRFSLYAAGDDMWMFQRFAYRIYMQGYWLHGGEPAFWFQPLYRWIAGALHMIFGDSSMGEFWWDAACILFFALLAHQATAVTNGFRWGLAAAVLALTITMQGPMWSFIGLGLSDIASAGLIYLAALLLASARRRGDVPLASAMAAGVLASIGFYTRLNNITMAAATAVFALPLTMAAGELWRPKAWLPKVSWRAVIGVGATIVLALLLFAARTYHYTGVFSVLHGTTWRNHALWQQGPAAMASSVMMVLTFNDPPRLAWYALPLLTAALVSLLALLNVKGFRDVPAPLALFFAIACSSALAARGVAYAGRFSVHLLGASCALTVCAIAALTKPARPEAGPSHAAIREAKPRGSSRSSDPARE